MSNNSKYFLSKALGEDFLESLAKTDIWKAGTGTVSDLDDMRVGLKIVPRALLSLLKQELTPMKVGEFKDIDLPLPNDARFHVGKHERDQYSGEIFENNVKIGEFKFRSIPGLGLVIMSTFELYSMEEEKASEKAPSHDINEEKIQKLVDERVALHRMIDSVVEGKLRERDAVQSMILAKLTDSLDKKSSPEPVVVILEKKEIEVAAKKQSPVKSFLDNRKKKNEFSIHMVKGESVDCQDCGGNIFDSNKIQSCICYGQDFGRKVFLKKTEDGIKVKFSSGWDIENISMLLETLRNKNNAS